MGEVLLKGEFVLPSLGEGLGLGLQCGPHYFASAMQMIFSR